MYGGEKGHSQTCVPYILFQDTQYQKWCSLSILLCREPHVTGPIWKAALKTLDWFYNPMLFLLNSLIVSTQFEQKNLGASTVSMSEVFRDRPNPYLTLTPITNLNP